MRNYFENLLLLFAKKKNLKSEVTKLIRQNKDLKQENIELRENINEMLLELNKNKTIALNLRKKLNKLKAVDKSA